MDVELHTFFPGAKKSQGSPLEKTQGEKSHGNNKGEKVKLARRKPRQARAQKKYYAILNASIKVLMREGYDGTNTSNIAKEANVAVGSLYEYFPNKESIFTAYLDEQITSLLGIINKKAESIGTGNKISNVETLRLWLMIAFEACYQNREVLRVLINEVPGVLDLFSLKGFEQQLFPLAQVLAEGSEMSEAQLQIKTFVLSNALFGFMLRSLFSEVEISESQIVEELLKLVMAYSETK